MLGFVKKFVENSFKRPNVLLSLGFLLLPVAFTFLLRIFLGISLQPLQLGVVFVKELFLWVFSAAVLYILVRLFKGSDVKGKFLAILGALSLRYVFSFLAMLLVFLVVFTIIPGQFFSKIAQIQSSSVSEQQILGISQAIEELSVQNETALFAGIATILLLEVFFVLLNLYLLYSIILGSSKEKHGRNLFILIVFILINYAVVLFL